MSKKADLERIKYVRETNVHHLFELLASRVLSKRPADVYSFLREQIDDIERVEKGAKHDPSQLPSRAAAQAPAAPSAPSTSSPGVTAAPSAIAVSAQKGPIKVTLAVFGLDNAGKTALIASVGGAPDDKTTPTVGFSPVMFETDKYDVCMFDLGGAATFRGIWPHYFHDLHGVVFVVDGSDAVRVAEAAKVLDEILQHPYLRTKPLAVFVNKKDKAGYMGADAVAAKLNLSTLSDRYHMPLRVASCCAVQLDDGIDESMDWLLTTVAERYESLAAVVKAHTAEVREEKKKRLEEQARRVEAAKLAEEQAAAAAAGSA